MSALAKKTCRCHLQRQREEEAARKQTGIKRCGLFYVLFKSKTYICQIGLCSYSFMFSLIGDNCSELTVRLKYVLVLNVSVITLQIRICAKCSEGTIMLV